MLTTTQTSTRTGIPSHRLHHWARSGLVRPSHRTHGGQARYDDADVRRLRIVKALMRGGVGTHKAKRLLPELAVEVESMVAEVVMRALGEHSIRR